MSRAENLANPVFEKISWQAMSGFDCCGIGIGLRCDAPDLVETLTAMMPQVCRPTAPEESGAVISLIGVQDENSNGLYFNNEPALKFERYDETLFEACQDKILFILAIVSLPTKFYLHAGAVSWKNQGILIPGDSFSGKTTLVKDLIKAGGTYITDDLAVLNDEAQILPFPKSLAIRTETGRELRTAADFGARTITEKVDLKIIIFTEYKKNAVWEPVAVPPGEALMRLLQNFYYRAAVREYPAEIIGKLARIVRRTKVFYGRRGDTESVIGWLSANFQVKSDEN